MPLERGAAIQLGLLLLAVPAQYFVSQYFAVSESQRTFAIRNLLNNAVGFRNKYLSWKSWQQWCLDIIGGLHDNAPPYTGQDNVNGESPAVEVLKYKDPLGYFAGDPDPRSPRAPNVELRVGQVVRHKIWGYRGVVIGWDVTARAPESWLKENHAADKSHWRKMPNYAILVDTRDRMSPQMTYVPQENLQVITSTRVMHPSMDHYFEKFDGAQYIPRPWLKAVYPHD